MLPYKESTASKKEQIEEMFDGISGRYDFLNRLLSSGIDVTWRNKLTRDLSHFPHRDILDVATGTGDVAFALAKAFPKSQILGVDIANEMLNIARKKSGKRSLDQRVRFRQEDAEALNIENDSFDAATVAFGVRNFENLEIGLKEINRVLRKGGVLMILEFSIPRNIFVRFFYGLYFKYLVPFLGKLISKDSEAYSYLYESVQEFPHGEEFATILKKCGFDEVKYTPLTFGICTLYEAQV